nr:histone deacetylase 14 [Tanacetum cinerariifolium]
MCFDQECWTLLQQRAMELLLSQYIDDMANKNVPAPAPIRSDDQILPFNAWVPIGKSDAIMDFVNVLGYSEEIYFVSRMAVNNLYQLWRAILSMINQCLTRKTSGFDWPRYPVLQMLWGIIAPINVDYAKLMWEKFIQVIQTFLADKANLGIATKKDKKIKHHVIPYCRFTKRIIYHLGRKHNINQRSGSSFNMAEDDHYLGDRVSRTVFADVSSSGCADGPVDASSVAGVRLLRNDWSLRIIYHLGRKHNINQRSGSSFNMAEDDHYLGNLKFVPKCKKDKVFGMQIPKELITNNIRNAPYYNSYLEMVVKHDYKITAEEGGKKKSTSKADQSKKPATAKQPKPVSSKQSKPAPGKQPKLVKEKSTKPTPSKKASKGITKKLLTVEGKGKGIATDEQVAQSLLDLNKPKKKSTRDQLFLKRHTPATEEASTGPSAQPEDDTSANTVHDTLSPTDRNMYLEEKTAEINEGQAGSDPGKTPESRPPPERVLMEEDQAGPNPGQSHVALAGPDPELMHDDFTATVYPQVHGSLKHPDEEHVRLENTLSSTRTLSSMKILDNFTFGDQFIAVKSLEDEPRNANMETEVESMVTVPIPQASSFVPPLSTPVIDLTPPKHVSSTVQEPLYTATTETTTTTLPPPPLLSTPVIDLTPLKPVFSTVQELVFTATTKTASRVSALETIDQTINEVVKEDVQTAIQAPLRECFKDLSKADIKKILHQRMFESGSYKCHPEHEALYEALEVSMDRDNQEELHETLTTSRKRHRDDQDPPPPLPKDSDRSKRRSRILRHLLQKSLKPIDDVSIPDDVHILDFKDIGAVPLPKIKTRPDWLKPVTKEDRLKTLKPDWTVPSNDLPEPENN